MGWLCTSSSAETEATCIWNVSPQIVVYRNISKSLYYECQVRGSLCERSEEYIIIRAGFWFFGGGARVGVTARWVGKDDSVIYS